MPISKIRSLLVPVTNSPASMEAIALACSIARPQKAKVYAVHVIEVLRSLPLNAEMEEEARRGEQLLRKAEDIAHHADYQLTGELLQARDAGQAIVDEAEERQVDGILMGIGYKRLIGGYQVGRTADYVLKNAHCQVWVVRQAVGEPGEGPKGRAT